MKFVYWIGIVSALILAGVFSVFMAHDKIERNRILRNYGHEYLKLVKSNSR